MLAVEAGDYREAVEAARNILEQSAVEGYVIDAEVRDVEGKST